MRIADRFLVWLFLAALLSACSGKPAGSEFVGGWEPVKSGSGPSFQISKEGDAFLLVDNTGAKVAATYDAQTHVLNVSMGPMGNVPFSYLSTTDHLSAMGDEFKRATSDRPATAASRGKTSSLDEQAVAFGKSLFTKNMVSCNGRTFMELSTSGNPLRAAIPGELKNPTFTTDGNSAGKGDNLNGIDWTGSIAIHWEAYRYYLNHRWTDWFNGDGSNAPFEPSIQNRESVLILHKNGQWLHDDSYSGQRDFVGVRKKPLTCEAIPTS